MVRKGKRIPRSAHGLLAPFPHFEQKAWAHTQVLAVKLNCVSEVKGGG